jgi:DNA invertase Pin-like site-specific DNA recombinase
MSRIIAYLRVSTVGQVEDGAGLESQLDACTGWAAARSVELAEVHQDAGISGAKQPHERPGLMAAIATLEPGDTLLVYKRDRLARDMMASLLADDLITKQGARVVSTQGEASEDDTPTGQFIRTVLDAVSQYERAMIKARLMAGRNAKKARGHQTTRIIPYGFMADPENAGKLIKSELEQAVLSEAATLRAAGMSLRDIADALAARGMVARNGKPFSAKVLNDILKRAA